MSPSDRLLPLLQRTSPMGGGRYRASCPTALHPNGDRSRGLYITVLPDEKLLLKCFAGCDAYSIVSAVGLELSDLFPGNVEENKRPIQPRWNYQEIVEIARQDVYLSICGMERLLGGGALTEEEVESARSALYRLRAILEVQ